ncbi:MAG: hypothetical protein JSR45_12510 [Proteobacteria bacterium]|nr:hypothetical protein [Pseudomonadota bacterium]
MLDLRSPLTLGAPAAALTLGLLAWAVLGGGAPAATRMTEFDQRLEKLQPRAIRGAAVTGASAADAIAHPIFAVGTAALADATLRLDGVALTPRRQAALLSINGKNAEWLERGDTRDGVTVQAITATKVVIDTATGPRDVLLGDKSAGDASPVAKAAPTGAPRG